MPKEKFDNCIDNASLEKLAKRLSILIFLTQTKAFLSWKSLNKNNESVCGQMVFP